MKNSNEVTTMVEKKLVARTMLAGMALTAVNPMFALLTASAAPVYFGYKAFQGLRNREALRSKQAEATKIKAVAAGQQPADADLIAKLKAARTTRGMKL